MTQPLRLATIAVPAVMFTLGIAACGGSSSSSSTTAASTTSTQPSGAGQTIKTSADPDGAVKFTQTLLTAKSGSVTIDMSNPSSSGIEHGIAVEGNGVDQDGTIGQPGDTATVTADLQPRQVRVLLPLRLPQAGWHDGDADGQVADGSTPWGLPDSPCRSSGERQREHLGGGILSVWPFSPSASRSWRD
jgi:hypothetical protein